MTNASSESTPRVLAAERAWLPWVAALTGLGVTVQLVLVSQAQGGRTLGLLLGSLLTTLLLGSACALQSRRSARWRAELDQALDLLRKEGESKQRIVRALEENAEFFHALSQGSPVGMYRTDATGILLYCNDTYLEIMGLDLEQGIGSRFCDSVCVADQSRVVALCETALQEFEGIDVSTSVDHQDGSNRSVTMMARPMFTEAGLFIGHAGSLLDLSQRVQLEREREEMRVQLVQSQRLESMGRMAAGIAHEINTPIQYIANNTTFLQEAASELLNVVQRQRALLSDSATTDRPAAVLQALSEVTAATDVEYLLDRMPRALADSREGIERVTRVVGAMREFAHPGSGHVEPVDINRAIASTVTVARNEWKHCADLTLTLAESLPLVDGFGCELNQALLNLLMNAVQAIEERQSSEPDLAGTIFVSTRAEASEAVIEIRDNGCGIAPELLGKLYDPFFTTKEIGKGTGQGLTLVRATICNQHHGTISVNSTVSAGTTFTVRLPYSASGGHSHG